jgi:hypothetical protein
MYKANQRHLQPLLISNVQDLPQKHQKRLADSWAGVFYRELFCRIQEAPFAGMYADFPSRPNVPVNVLVGLETLKAGFGWSDEELYDHFVFDLQVRYALGLRDLGEGDFELRSLYNFRRRLSEYNQQHQVNLLEQAFEAITDQQIQSLKLDTHQQRMDSTQIASNILDMSRLQLLVEACQRLYRQLSEPDQQQYAEGFGPYLQGSSGQFVYRIKGKDATQQAIQQVGQDLYAILAELQADYASQPAYQVLQRFFGDNFQVHEQQVRAKANEEISAQCLQSCDDLEATFRRKQNCAYKGYVANLTQTCASGNPLQLVTKVQVAPNHTQDSDLLVEALPNLKVRTELQTVYTDGAYSSPEADQALQQAQVELVATAIKGRRPDPDQLTLEHFEIQLDEHGLPQQITCPGQQTVAIRLGRKKGAFVADFEPERCATCPFHQADQCRAKPGKRDRRYHLDFNQQEAQVARRRRLKKAQEQSGHNLRAAIEALMRVIKHPFSGGKLPVRGLFRVSSLIIASALMVNVRSIHRYEQAKAQTERSATQDAGAATALQAACDRSISALAQRLAGFLRSYRWNLPCFSW